MVSTTHLKHLSGPAHFLAESQHSLWCESLLVSCCALLVDRLLLTFLLFFFGAASISWESYRSSLDEDTF